MKPPSAKKILAYVKQAEKNLTQLEEICQKIDEPLPDLYISVPADSYILLQILRGYMGEIRRELSRL